MEEFNREVLRERLGLPLDTSTGSKQAGPLLVELVRGFREGLNARVSPVEEKGESSEHSFEKEEEHPKYVEDKEDKVQERIEVAKKSVTGLEMEEVHDDEGDVDAVFTPKKDDPEKEKRMLEELSDERKGVTRDVIEPSEESVEENEDSMDDFYGLKETKKATGLEDETKKGGSLFEKKPLFLETADQRGSTLPPLGRTLPPISRPLSQLPPLSSTVGPSQGSQPPRTTFDSIGKIEGDDTESHEAEDGDVEYFDEASKTVKRVHPDEPSEDDDQKRLGEIEHRIQELEEVRSSGKAGQEEYDDDDFDEIDEEIEEIEEIEDVEEGTMDDPSASMESNRSGVDHFVDRSANVDEIRKLDHVEDVGGDDDDDFLKSDDELDDDDDDLGFGNEDTF
eukprot:TRINITY_DN1302_c0_g1_i2.p1 TRINITY_DN1302_c0_g1~~TRINITY_DN1302_c0_g1_i2.p1  ORF type:complete len:394 (-),score=187.50 TRINITY_DN1302_c0_g1_i2:213-1394(-)